MHLPIGKKETAMCTVHTVQSTHYRFMISFFLLLSLFLIWFSSVSLVFLWRIQNFLDFEIKNCAAFKWKEEEVKRIEMDILRFTCSVSQNFPIFFSSNEQIMNSGTGVVDQSVLNSPDNFL